MEPQEIAKHLRKPEGETGIKVGNTMNAGNALMYDLIFKIVPFQKGGSFLELGFGNGKHIPEVVNKSPLLMYTGLDYSATMVQEASFVILEEKISRQARVAEGDIEKMPFPDQSFDYVFTANTIYFWSRPEECIKEIARVLKPGGLCYILYRPKDVA